MIEGRPRTNQVLGEDGFIYQTQVESKSFFSPELRLNKEFSESLVKSLRFDARKEESHVFLKDISQYESATSDSTEPGPKPPRRPANASTASNLYAGEPEEGVSSSTINIYQNNNIVINITNDNSANLRVASKKTSNVQTKNVYYDFSKFPTNAFSKKKPMGAEGRDTAPKQGSQPRSALAKTMGKAPPKALRARERQKGLSSSTGFNRSQVLQKFAPPARLDPAPVFDGNCSDLYTK